MRHVVLYRSCNSLAEDTAEIDALKSAGFVHLTNRTLIQPGDLVIARYSAIPFYRELESDLKEIGATLINSYQQHQYVADLQNYVADLRELTPTTWSRLEDVPDEGSFILKGATNSRKGQWKTHCFAENKAAAIQVHGRLSDDGLIGQQNIYIRRYVPLYQYGLDVQGMPVTKEFRFFIFRGKILSGGFYWSSQLDLLENVPSVQEVDESFLNTAIDRIKDRVNFVVMDVALTADNKEICIELNDGQMSGLSENDPNVLYSNLKKELDQWAPINPTK